MKLPDKNSAGHAVNPAGLDVAVPDAQARLLAWAVGAIFGLATLAILYSNDQKTNFEDLALGEETTSIYASSDGYKIHCSDARDLHECIEGASAHPDARVVIWLGNSQVHAVNQLKPGQTNAPALLHEHLKPQGMYLLTFSQPNANLQEHLVLFEYLLGLIPVKTLILPVVFDDMRETGMREDIAKLSRDMQTRRNLEKKEIGRRLLAANEVPDTDDDDMAGITNTAQERVEKFLDLTLDKNSALWKLRPELRGHLFNGLYELRNTLLGVKASTKRKYISSRYRDNMVAMGAILASAREFGIRVLAYVAPLRNDVEPPYVREEYQRFKKELAALTESNGATLVDLENLVPGNLWGRKSGTGIGVQDEIDFMHFRAPGHELLAARLYELTTSAARDTLP